MPTVNYISQIRLPDGTVYNIKDAAAWSFMNTEFRKEIVQSLPDYNSMSQQQLEQALHTIYLVPSSAPVSGSGVENSYDEYVLLQHGDANNYTYTWELIGTTTTDLTNFSEKGHVHEVTPQTQVADHTFTVSGQTPVPDFHGSSTSFSAEGSVSDGDVTINIADANGTGTLYTPEGSLGGTTENESSHTHTIGGRTKYVEKATIYKIGTSGASVQPTPTESNTYNKIAQVADSQTSIQKYTIGQGSVTVTPTTNDRADGTLKDTTNNVLTNAVFHDATVTDEVLSFTLKDLNVGSTVTGIASASTSANTVTANGTEDFYACKDGTGKTIHDYTYGAAVSAATFAGTTQTVLTQIVDFTEQVNAPTVISSLNANTGAGTAHSHSLGSNATFTGVDKRFSGSIEDGSVSVSGTLTPQGYNSFAQGEGTFTSDPVTLAHNVNNPTVTSTPDVFDEESRLLEWYGVRWDITSSDPHKERIGNMDMHRSLPIQNGMRRCLLKSDGTVYAYLDHYDSRYYAVGSKDENGNDIGGQIAALDGSKGQVMVEIPRHWFNANTVTIQGATYMQVAISPYQQRGWKEMDKCYVGAYEASYDETKLCSVSEGFIEYGHSLSWYREKARANEPTGNHWNIMPFTIWTELYWLFVIEYANTNYREAYNPQLTALGFKQGGLSDFLGAQEEFTGVLDMVGNGTYCISFMRIYHGIEYIFGNYGCIFDGAQYSGSTASATNNPSLFESPRAYLTISASAPSSAVGYISEITMASNPAIHGVFAPKTLNGSSTSYYCGYFTGGTGTRCVVATDGFLDLDTSHDFDFNGDGSIATRLVYLTKASSAT